MKDFLDYPLHLDGRGRAAVTGEDDHIRDLIHQVLFTNPGERVNRPDFGCGLMQLVFAPNSPELAATVQALVHAALQQWLPTEQKERTAVGAPCAPANRPAHAAPANRMRHLDAKESATQDPARHLQFGAVGGTGRWRP